MTDKLPIRIFRTRRLLDTPFIKVDEHRISYRRDNDDWSPPQIRLNVERGNSVAAILFEPASELLHFVRQFRFSTYDFGDEPNPANGWMVELIAGSVKPGEPLRDCVIREVKEETGFDIDAPQMIGSFYLTPGASSERLYLFYAEVSEQRRSRPEQSSSYGVEDEEIVTLTMTVAEFLTRIERMEICDAKTVAAGEWLRRKR
jgi:nudix-type nucleoside diphosphatase (YffH/AdpP family)